MSNYRPKDRSDERTDFAFSFSNTKSTPSQTKRQAFAMTGSERRGLAGWLSAVMQPHSEQFVNAIRSSETRGVVDLFEYIAINYAHLKEIVKYYAVALLVDYGWTDWHEQSKGNKGSNDVFLNIIIEEIAVRFYRESQWLTKISHIPFYEIFAIFDHYSKGYITIEDISAFLSGQVKYKQPKKASIETHCLQAKFKCNLGGFQCRIYQENLMELQQRTDIVAFNHDDLGKSKNCSQAYSILFGILSKQAQRRQHQHAEEEKQQQLDTQRELQELNINRQDLTIKMLSRSFVQPQKQQYPYPQLKSSFASSYNRGGLLPQSKKAEIHANSKALSDTRANMSKNTHLTESIHRQAHNYRIMRTTSKQDKENINAQLLKSASNDPINSLLDSQPLLEQKFLLKQSILCQLQHIKYQKYHNRTNLLTYI